MDSKNLEYRNLLISTQHQLNDSYDKLVVTLAGGALGLSIAFLKDIVSLEIATHKWLLIFSWLLFIVSLASIFCEILFGIEAYKKAVNQLDSKTIREEKVGGLFSSLTKWFSRIAAITLVTGLLTISVFIYLNVGSKYESKTGTQTTTQQTPTN